MGGAPYWYSGLFYLSLPTYVIHTLTLLKETVAEASKGDSCNIIDTSYSKKVA